VIASAVRVGFVTPLLWERFGPPWVSLVADVGAEVVLPTPERIVAALDDPHLERVEALAPRIAVAAAVACGDVDLLVVPELLAHRDGGRGSAQDPWVADLPTMIGRALPGGPGVIGVPVERGPHVANVVMPLLMRVNRDAGVVRRAWERRRRELETPWKGRGTTRAAAPADGPRVALVGPPWWLAPGALAILGRGAGTLVGQFQLDPEDARAEGRRVRDDLVDPDAEAIGAARRFARQAEVDAVRLAVDGRSATAGWLERRVREVAPRGLEVVSVDELADAAAWVGALTPAGRIA
jgi:hypothetical protein